MDMMGVLTRFGYLEGINLRLEFEWCSDFILRTIVLLLIGVESRIGVGGIRFAKNEYVIM